MGKEKKTKDTGRGREDQNEVSGARNRQLPQLDDLYREVVLDHYRNPRGRKKLSDPDASAEGFNPSCGDQVHVALSVRDGKVDEAHVECQGCSISVASGSMMAELLVGRSRDEIDEMTEDFKAMMHGREPAAGMDLGDLEALEGVRKFPVRIKCALLAWTTLQEALAAFDRRRQDGGPDQGPQAGGAEEETDADR